MDRPWRFRAQTQKRKVIDVAHEVESMFSSNRVVPWHGLGNVLPGYPDSREEVLTAAGLDWQVGEFPVNVELPDGTRIEAADRKGIVRLTDNSLLSIMGRGTRRFSRTS